MTTKHFLSYFEANLFHHLHAFSSADECFGVRYFDQKHKLRKSSYYEQVMYVGHVPKMLTWVKTAC